MRQAFPYIRAGAVGGLGSGVLALLLELATRPAGEGGLTLGLVLTSTILSTFLLGGIALALLLLLLRALAQAIGRALGWQREHLLSASLVALTSLPPLLVLVQRLAVGRRAAEVLGPLWVQLGLAALGALLLSGLVWLGLHLGRRLAERRRPAAALALGGLLVGLAVALFLADAYLYRRLYGYLHNLLLLAYLTAGLLGTLALASVFRRPGGPLRRWLLPLTALALILLGGAWWSRSVLVRDQRLRFAAGEQSTVAANILSLFPLDVGSEAPLFLDSSPLGQASHVRETHRVEGANVVLVTVDALRADHLGCYGYHRPTSPNIDALAARAVRFDRAYCQAPLTCYSVPSLLTGDYLKSTLPLMSKNPPTLARILAARGYTTAAFYNASIFFCDDRRATSYGDQKFGFGYAETELRPAPALTDQVLRYLQSFRASGKRRLFLWVHYFDVHEPYHRIPEHDFGDRAMDRYDSEIAHVDQSVGRLVASLHQLEGPTIFILSADHGEEFKEHGGNYHGSSLYEEQVRVPLIFAVPGVKPLVVRTPAQLVDVAPTVLSLLGARQPRSIRGQSLVPELLGKGSPDRIAFSEVHTKKMLRFRNWKLIYDFRRSTFQLYDLLTDPRERTNLIGQRPREAAHLKSLLNSWFDRLRALGGKREEDRPEGIDLGRIGDRRAVPLLCQLLEDPDAQSRWRLEAAQLLGQLQDPAAASTLWAAAGDDDERVAAEAAIALGEIKDPSARVVLPDVVRTTDADLRMRAGIALGRVDSPRATPALIEALYSDNWEIENRAAHYLGFVADQRAIDPLLRMARWLHLRSRVALSLGRIGRRVKDRRILPFLLELVKHDHSAEVRQKALGGLGFLGDRRAVRPLAAILADDPDLTWTPETLSRLNGVGWYWVPGIDFSTHRRGLKEGWGRCVKGSSSSTDDYQGQTWCAMNSPRAAVQLQLRRPPFDAQLLIRYRGTGPVQEGAKLTVKVNGTRLPPQPLSGSWQAVRIPTVAKLWRAGTNTLRFSLMQPKRSATSRPAALAAVDYVMLAARRSSRL